MAALSDLKVDEADAAKFDALLGAQRGAADAAGCVKGVCSLALRGRRAFGPRGGIAYEATAWPLSHCPTIPLAHQLTNSPLQEEAIYYKLVRVIFPKA